jgi:hypothetical protein
MPNIGGLLLISSGLAVTAFARQATRSVFNDADMTAHQQNFFFLSFVFCLLRPYLPQATREPWLGVGPTLLRS